MNEIKPKKSGGLWFDKEFKDIMDEIIAEFKVESDIVDNNTNEETRTSVYSDQMKLVTLLVYMDLLRTLQQDVLLVNGSLVCGQLPSVTKKEEELKSPEDLFRYAEEEDIDMKARDKSKELD
jgi:hypothetical protein